MSSSPTPSAPPLASASAAPVKSKDLEANDQGSGGVTSETVVQRRKAKKHEAYDDTYLEDAKIQIPEELIDKSFSWKALWLFTGRDHN